MIADPLCLEASLLPKRFPGHEADFVGPLCAWPKQAELTVAPQELDAWLQRYDLDRLR